MKFKGQYSFLSNFYPSPFVTEKGTMCPTVEHAFQACKTLDKNEQSWVLAAPTPAQARKRGRKVTLREGWNSNRRKIMETLVTMKFEQNPKLALKLVQTGDEILIEDNGWGDTYWGRCAGEGENHLGKILMRVRRKLQRKIAKSS